MAKLSVTVCDICERIDAPVHRYRISKENGSSRVFDLCDQHAAPLEALLDAKRDGGSGPVRRFDDTIVTIEQLEAMKGKGEA